MRCPFCDHDDTQVIDSRVSDDGDSVRRRRRCPECDKRFTTYERIELSMPAVVKKNGSRVEFDGEKLMSLALREVPSERIGELVMRELKKLDKIAYIRFASVYRNFEDLDEFSDAIREVKKPRVRKPRTS